MSSALALPPPTNTTTSSSVIYDKSYYIDTTPNTNTSTTLSNRKNMNSSSTLTNNNTAVPLHQQKDFFLPTTPPLTSSNKHRHQRSSHSRHLRHQPDRRRDAFELLQVIIQENEKREHEEYEAMLRDVPEIVARRSSTSQDLPSILIKKNSSSCSSSSSSSSSSSITPTPITPTTITSNYSHNNSNTATSTTIREEEEEEEEEEKSGLFVSITTPSKDYNTPPPSPKRPSVRFAADLLHPPTNNSTSKVPSELQPPQPQPSTSRTSFMTNKLRSFLHLSSKKVSNL